MKIQYSAVKNAFFPLALKDDYDAAGTWPSDAIEVPYSSYLEFITPRDGMRRVAGPDGLPVWAPAPIPSEDEIKARKIALVQTHMDIAARQFGYDSVASAISYAEEPAVPKFQTEGQAFRAWRSLVWARCYEILEQVQNSERAIPTDEELINELPVLSLLS